MSILIDDEVEFYVILAIRVEAEQLKTRKHHRIRVIIPLGARFNTISAATFSTKSKNKISHC